MAPESWNLWPNPRAISTKCKNPVDQTPAVRSACQIAPKYRNPVDQTPTERVESGQQAADPPPKPQIIDRLRPFAQTLQGLLGAGKAPGPALRMLKERMSGVTDALNTSSLSFNAFIDKFPDLIQRKNGKLYPTNQGTLK